MPTTCAICHDPHAKDHEGQLRWAIDDPNPDNNLCMKCHNRRTEPQATSSRGSACAAGRRAPGHGGVLAGRLRYHGGHRHSRECDRQHPAVRGLPRRAVRRHRRERKRRPSRRSGTSSARTRVSMPRGSRRATRPARAPAIRHTVCGCAEVQRLRRLRLPLERDRGGERLRGEPRHRPAAGRPALGRRQWQPDAVYHRPGHARNEPRSGRHGPAHAGADNRVHYHGQQDHRRRRRATSTCGSSGRSVMPTATARSGRTIRSCRESC